MTQQDDTAQRVLTDDEILTVTLYGQSEARMIRNGRAIESAVLSKLRAPVADEREAFEASYRERYRVPAHVLSLTYPDVPAAWEWWKRRAALASAPVADESPMAKMAEALREKARQEQRAYQDRRDQATEWGPMPAGTEADDPSALAALADGLESIVGNENAKLAAVIIRRMASAPVAEQAALSAQSATKDDKAALGLPECGKPLCAPGEHHPLCRHGWAEKKGVSDPVAGEAMQLLRSIREQDYLSDTMRHRIDRLLTNAAPQASEAVDRSPNLQGSQVDESAELQGIASEAVRDAVHRLRNDLMGIEEDVKHDGYAAFDHTCLKTLQRVIEGLAALSAQPAAEPLSNPKQFALTGVDERTAFEATYKADYDDPGAACEREHFGKGYRAGMAAQSVADKLERDYAAGKWPPPPGTYEVERTVNLAHPKQHNDGADCE